MIENVYIVLGSKAMSEEEINSEDVFEREMRLCKDFGGLLP